MSRPSTVLWASVALVLNGLPAAAQTPPPRNGNIYDGTAHEPNPSAVHQNERAAGVMPSASVQKKERNTVEQLDRQLLGPKDNLNPPPAK